MNTSAFIDLVGLFDEFHTYTLSLASVEMPRNLETPHPIVASQLSFARNLSSSTRNQTMLMDYQAGANASSTLPGTPFWKPT
jgi:hypothetical protein